MRLKINRNLTLASLGVLAVAGIALAQDQGVQAVIGNVFLQNTTPGTSQVGHATITGTFRAGQVFVQQASARTIPVVGNSTAVGAGATVGGSFSAGQASSIGIRGTATNVTGSAIGVLDVSRSSSGFGVRGEGDTGVKGVSIDGTGVEARSTSSTALFAESESGLGVFVRSGTNIALRASATTVKPTLDCANSGSGHAADFLAE